MKARPFVITAAALAALGVSQPSTLGLAQTNGMPGAIAPSSTAPMMHPTTGTGANTASQADLSSSDVKFLQKAARGGALEVALGHLAAQRATSPQVKQFGQRMIDDHSQANQELRQLAARKGVSLDASQARSGTTQSEARMPDQNGAVDTIPKLGTGGPATTAASGVDTENLDSEGRKTADKLADTAAGKFDRDYMKLMVSDHEKDVKEFEDASKNAEDPDVKAFAAKTLPTLQEHLSMARETQKAANSSATSGGTGKTGA